MTDYKCAHDFKTFVLMPFGNNQEYEGGHDESEYVYTEIIRPAVRLAMGKTENEPDIIREVDRNKTGSITASIVEDLVKADVVIVDITGRNPNVFLELGMRYALRNKITIIIAQKGTLIPFDITGYRYIEYNRFLPDEARKRIARFINEGFKDEMQSDSVVFDVFRKMSVIIPGVTESHGVEPTRVRDTMRWDEFMGRIGWICQLLQKQLQDGAFVPDALVGITNGGLIVADLIGRELFRGTPILALWANRFSHGDSDNWFFENPYDKAVVEALRQAVAEKQRGDPIAILLVDDNLGTGNTAQQAIGFLKSKLGNETQILFIPLVSRDPKYVNPSIENFLPYAYKDHKGKKIFPTQKEEFLSRLNTKARYLPYLDKEIKGS
jgi:hypoxanthine phosphoribosyltransferase